MLKGLGRRLLAVPMRRCRYTLPGLCAALVFACLSFTPSLLPRPALFQGVITGIDAAIGYGLGVGVAWVWREFADRPARTPRRWAWPVLAVVAALAVAGSMVLGLRWQWQLARLTGVDLHSPVTALLVLPVAAVLFVTFVGLARGCRTAHRGTVRVLDHFMGLRAARASGLVLLVVSLVAVMSGVVWQGALNAADASFAVADKITPGDVTQPTSALRSGSAQSLVSWESLGREGRAFTGRGPSAQAIAALTPGATGDPVRVYAGMASADSAEARAALAVRDLERAGGFERKALLVATTTGTGWVEPSAATSFEYLTGGDSAIVAMQYSHLPSWLSYLVDQSRARESGRELFDAVYARWQQLPRAQRPRLYVFGESLGSFGGETAFSGEHDLANRVSGALFVGPPRFNPLYREFVDGRDAGSPEVEPVYRQGRVVRFSNDPRDPVPPSGQPWPGPRVLYVQNPSDPITWWSTDLVLGRPDWLREPRGRDVLASVHWIPFVTFWQLSADLALGSSPAPGHGHNYRGVHVDAWAAVLQPDGWTPARADAVRAAVLGR